MVVFRSFDFEETCLKLEGFAMSFEETVGFTIWLRLFLRFFSSDTLDIGTKEKQIRGDAIYFCLFINRWWERALIYQSFSPVS